VLARVFANLGVVMPEKKQRLDKDGVKRIIQLSLTLLFIMAVLFASAGTLDYPEAWTLLEVYLIALLIGGVYIGLKNPEAINARGRWRGGIKKQELIIVTLYSIATLMLLIVAGFDFRYKWSVVPQEYKLLGIASFFVSMVIAYWTMYVNSYLAVLVKVDKKHGQRVITTGPYHYVRHPLYVGIIISLLGMPLLLGSYVAFIPAVLAIFFLSVRSVLEEKTLMKELKGYKEYTRKTKYRLIPGVW
jgi:protein-S-isoprenylcysteine O-methyltransferase Ste14